MATIWLIFKQVNLGPNGAKETSKFRAKNWDDALLAAENYLPNNYSLYSLQVIGQIIEPTTVAGS